MAIMYRTLGYAVLSACFKDVIVLEKRAERASILKQEGQDDPACYRSLDISLSQC